MPIKKHSIHRSDFDYEEDDYDRYKSISRNSSKYKVYTNKATMEKPEFDYEEDPYEPEKSK